MYFGRSSNNNNTNKSVGIIRKTQLVSTFATGAIAEMPEYTVVMAGSNYWHDAKNNNNKRKKIYEPNLQRLLGMKYFLEPITSESLSPMGNPDMPAFRFPRMHFCPKCGKLDEYKSFGDPKNKKCSECKRKIVPSRFIAVCMNGHLEDFPFEWWVHGGNLMGCTDPTDHHKLKIEFKDNTGGLSSIVIHCTKCNKKRSMEGCMSSKALKGYRCRGKRPWLGIRELYNDPIECKNDMRVLQRGASNAYYSITQSALTIPPWSNRLHEEIETIWDKFKRAFEQDIDDDKLNFMIGIEFNHILDSGNYTIEDIKSAIQKRRGAEQEEDNFTEQKLYEDEYRALCAGYENIEPGEHEEFHAEITEISPFLQNYFEEVVLVKRLREVMAFKGFRRLIPNTPDDNEETDGASENTREYMPPWDTPLPWLPAIEMRGEGIFLVLNIERLNEWEQKNAVRYVEMKKRLGTRSEKFSPRFVLLHTLSHLLIRQLTIECGYQEAALKERIYSTYNDDDALDMAGILIYTSSSDSDGSLGGLVRQGEYDLLESTMRNLLEEATWCSSDPLCIESKNQGLNSLNYAACHACTLIPETSCETNNTLLDRVAVVGKPDDRHIGFFGDLLRGDMDDV